jgi:hypothetical protein
MCRATASHTPVDALRAEAGEASPTGPASIIVVMPAASERFVDGEVLPVELVDPRLYHLDMALAVLDDGTAVVCRKALSATSLDELERHPALRELVSVPLEEALRFGVNVVQIGRTIVWARTLRRRQRRSLGADIRRPPSHSISSTSQAAAQRASCRAYIVAPRRNAPTRRDASATASPARGIVGHSDRDLGRGGSRRRGQSGKPCTVGIDNEPITVEGVELTGARAP